MNAQTKIEAETLASAMAAAFGEIEAATKASENPAFKQGGRAIRYADLTSVIDAIKPALIKHNLFFTQRPEPCETGVCIATHLHHAGGESMSLGTLFVPANKNDAQGFGSALTYARRYALVTAFGVPVEDDDGNAAAKAQAGASRGRSSESAVSPDGPALIDDAQWSQLAQLMKASGADAKKFLAHYAITDLRDLPAASFGKARDQLNSKLAKKVKEDTNKQGFGEVLEDEIPY